MTIFDWLITGDGHAVVWSLILLLQAITGWVTYRTHQQVKNHIATADEARKAIAEAVYQAHDELGKKGDSPL